ncbi:MAG: hypothetical protein LBQ74_13935 [Prevotella sp.]|nr:hypothetical protein [Prevotella sp.]
MEQQLDDALNAETKKSLTDWLNNQRMTDIQKLIIDSLSNRLLIIHVEAIA